MTHAATADAPFAAPPNLVRLSVGIESAHDLMDDLENALVPAAARSSVSGEAVVFVEIPSGSRNKYEWDEELGGIVLDRRLFTAMTYPADYGYVEGTLAEDGDPLDALVLVSDPTFPGCRIRVRAIGVFHMADEKGPDEKLLCVPLGDPAFERVGRHPRRPERAARRDRALLPALQGPRAVEADRDARLGQPRRGGEDPRRRPRARLDRLRLSAVVPAG